VVKKRATGKGKKDGGKRMPRRKQLKHKISELKQAAHYREIFIGILAHDLRNPLSVIHLASDAISHVNFHAPDSTVEQQVLAGTVRIKNNTIRMNKLIQQTLDFARINLGDGIPICRVSCDAGQLTEQIVADLNLLQSNNDQVHFQSDGDLTGYWDADRMQQVISNLVRNAMTHGVSPLEVQVYRVDGVIYIAVLNGGKPIPPKMLARVFLPFTRQRTTSQSGLGLGLYIANEIVKAHGGKIDVASNDQKTTFTVELPVGTAATPIEDCDDPPSALDTALGAKETNEG